MIILLTQGSYSDYNVAGLVDVPSHEVRPWLEAREAEADHANNRPRDHFSECRGLLRSECTYCGNADRLRANADKAAQELHARCEEMLVRSPVHRLGFAHVAHIEVRRDA